MRCEVWRYKDRPNSRLLVYGNEVINGAWDIVRTSEGVFGHDGKVPLVLLGHIDYEDDYNEALERFEQSQMNQEGATDGKGSGKA